VPAPGAPGASSFLPVIVAPAVNPVCFSPAMSTPVTHPAVPAGGRGQAPELAVIASSKPIPGKMTKQSGVIVWRRKKNGFLVSRPAMPEWVSPG